MENLEISHDILVAGPDFESCRKRVIRFFDRTTLIRYDEVLIPENESVNGEEKKFSSRLQEGLAANKKVLGELLENLKAEGFVTLEDLQGLEKGYVSKIFHTIAHLLDGFIGIDSRFYNLEEDSHGISRDLERKIHTAPHNFWMMGVQGRIAPAGEDPFDALRTFEWKGMDND
jgi:alanyl-tRNA synthetase